MMILNCEFKEETGFVVNSENITSNEMILFITFLLLEILNTRHYSLRLPLPLKDISL